MHLLENLVKLRILDVKEALESIEPHDETLATQLNLTVPVGVNYGCTARDLRPTLASVRTHCATERLSPQHYIVITDDFWNTIKQALQDIRDTSNAKEVDSTMKESRIHVNLPFSDHLLKLKIVDVKAALEIIESRDVKLSTMLYETVPCAVNSLNDPEVRPTQTEVRTHCATTGLTPDLYMAVTCDFSEKLTKGLRDVMHAQVAELASTASLLQKLESVKMES